MDDSLIRESLISAIIDLERSVANTGRTNITAPSDRAFLESFSTRDLRSMRTRFEELLRSLSNFKH